MLICTRTIEGEAVAGRTRIAEGHELARAHPDAFRQDERRNVPDERDSWRMRGAGTARASRPHRSTADRRARAAGYRDERARLAAELETRRQWIEREPEPGAYALQSETERFWSEVGVLLDRAAEREPELRDPNLLAVERVDAVAADAPLAEVDAAWAGVPGYRW